MSNYDLEHLVKEIDKFRNKSKFNIFIFLLIIILNTAVFFFIFGVFVYFKILKPFDSRIIKPAFETFEPLKDIKNEIVEIIEKTKSIIGITYNDFKEPVGTMIKSNKNLIKQVNDTFKSIDKEYRAFCGCDEDGTCDFLECIGITELVNAFDIK